MKYLYIICLFITFQLSAQKQIERQIEDPTIENVIINGKGIFKIKVSNHKDAVIKVKALVEGEHNEYIVLSTNTVDNTLTISSQWDPLFVQDNDKLSVHKVISIELEILLPKGLNLYIKSDIASAQIKGHYKQLMIELMNGNCNLETQSKDTKINTIEGNISVLTNHTAVKAITKNGSQEIDATLNGSNKMLLKTLNGNIIVRKQ